VHPLHINALWRLSDPVYAMGLGLAIILVVASLAYLPARRWPKLRRDRYKKTLALAAEILVSASVIGLLTFAARAKIDADIHSANRQSQELRREVDAEVWDFARLHCLERRSSTPPTRVVAALDTACRWWPDLIKAPGEFVDWWGARESFKEMALAVSEDPGLAAQFLAISRRLDALIAAEDEAALDAHEKGLVEEDVSWEFITLCAVMAMTGMALKLTRAALDSRLPS
jgi:hypothetical protein